MEARATWEEHIQGAGTTRQMGTQETEDLGQGPLRGGGGVHSKTAGVFMGALECH